MPTYHSENLPRTVMPMALPTEPSLRLHDPHDPRRAEVEEFIRRVYARRYGALVPSFAPMLVSLCDPGDGSVVAAAGYRAAQLGPLFLERYLGAPVEAVLAAHAGVCAARAEVVEIGHLAADRAGAGRSLMLLLRPHLARQGFGWAVSTLTRELRLLLARMGITPLELARAEPAALADEAALWGSYYEHEPVVVAGQVRSSSRGLTQAGRERRPGAA